jgi:hypothetical protein
LAKEWNHFFFFRRTGTTFFREGVEPLFPFL